MRELFLAIKTQVTSVGSRKGTNTKKLKKIKKINLIIVNLTIILTSASHFIQSFMI